MGEWILFQLPVDMPLAMLEGVSLNLDGKGVQSAGVVDALVRGGSLDHMLPLKDKKGKLKVGGKLIKSVQIVKATKKKPRKADKSTI